MRLGFIAAVVSPHLLSVKVSVKGVKNSKKFWWVKNDSA
jgi:hypothetical protein